MAARRDPKGLFKDPVSQNDTDINGQRVTTDDQKGKYYALTYTFNDGTKETRVYKYGSAGEDGQDQLVNTRNPGIDPEVKKMWDDEVKAGGSGQPTNGVMSIQVQKPDGVHIFGWDPAANEGRGGYTIDEGLVKDKPAAGGGNTAIRQDPDTGKWYDDTVDPVTGRVTSKQRAAPTNKIEPDPSDPNKWREIDTQTGKVIATGTIGKAPTLKSKDEVNHTTSDGRKGRLVTITMSDGTTQTNFVEAEKGKVEREKTETDKDGVTWVNKYDPETGEIIGRDRVADLSGGPGESAGLGFSGGPKADLTPGKAASHLEEYGTWLDEEVKAGRIKDKKTAADMLEARRNLLQTAITEQSVARQSAGQVLQTQTGERSDDAATARARLTGANQVFSDSLEIYKYLMDSGEQGSDAAAYAMLYLLDRGKKNVEDWGGLRDQPRTPIPDQIAGGVTYGGQPMVNNLPPGSPGTNVPTNSAPVPVAPGAANAAIISPDAAEAALAPPDPNAPPLSAEGVAPGEEGAAPISPSGDAIGVPGGANENPLASDRVREIWEANNPGVPMPEIPGLVPPAEPAAAPGVPASTAAKLMGPTGAPADMAAAPPVPVSSVVGAGGAPPPDRPFLGFQEMQDMFRELGFSEESVLTTASSFLENTAMPALAGVGGVPSVGFE